MDIGITRPCCPLPAATCVGPAMGPVSCTAPGTATACHAPRSCRLPALGTWLCLLLLTAACVPTTSSNPGIRARVTRRALEYGRRVGLELLRSLLQKEHEVNLHGSYRAPLLGRLNYTVPWVHVHELQINDSSVDFVEDVGVRLTVQRARIRLNATWAAQLGAWQDSGSVQLRAGDLAVAVLLGLGAADDGRPTAWAAGCDARGTDLHLEFRQGQSWLYNPLVLLLQRALRQQLNKQLCIQIQKGISRLQDSLKHLQVSAQLDPFAAIDLSLLGRPAVTAQHGDVSLKGEFFGVRRRWQSPFLAVPVGLPEVGLPEPMLLAAVTEFVANSATFVYFSAGALRRNVTAEMLPRRFPLKLKTESMGSFAPQLQQRFPSRPMELLLSARRQPLLSCRPDALHAALFGSAEAFVVLPDATRVPVFVLNIDANVTGKPTITGNRLGGTVGLKGLSVVQVTSHVGLLQVEKLENMLKYGLWLFGVPWANKRLRSGIPLPTPQGLTLQHPRLSLHEGYVLLATDVQYEP